MNDTGCNFQKDTVSEYKKRAKALADSMTLEEKVFQMVHTAAAIPRLNVKAYNWWNEGLHGVARAGTATVFPQAIGLAASFDEDLIEKVADAISTEGRAKFNMQQEEEDYDIYKGLTFWSPNINIFRDPRWGRGQETYGEDPYLTGRLGVRFVKGLQGHDEKYLKTAACAKHFAVHSGPESLRHSFDAKVSKKDLYETYLPAFKELVTKAKVESVMGAYNRVNGEPCCGSKTLLVDILRGEWKFDGHVVSDCAAIRDFHEGHMVTETPADSAALAVNNGCDLNCGKMFCYLLEAVKQGKITENEITAAVTRLITTRMKLGLFEENGKVPFDQISYDEVDSQSMKALNLEVAKKTLVLLKNENHTLPLDKNKLRTIGVIGPNANNRKALVGNYEGTASRYITVLEGIQDYVGEDIKVLYSEGCHLFKQKFQEDQVIYTRMSEVRRICKESDVIIACMGLDGSLEGEMGDTSNEFGSGDKPNLDLPGSQEKILETLCEYGKPVILILLSGSALAIRYAKEHVPAILQGWYPGAQGGKAIAETLFGEFIPEGRLPITFYKSDEDLPDFTDYSMKNRTYRFMQSEALYPFGFGLSYTKFSYSKLTVNRSKIDQDGIYVSVCVKNVGDVSGRETVQVYVKANCVTDMNAQLKAIQKVYLVPEEEKCLTLHLPIETFHLFDDDGKEYLPETTYTLYVSGLQPDERSQKLSQSVPLTVEVRS